MLPGQLLAIFSAVLFGISPALCKMVVVEILPVLLTGMFYLGSRLGLQFQLVFQRMNLLAEVLRLSPLHRQVVEYAAFGQYSSTGTPGQHA